MYGSGNLAEEGEKIARARMLGSLLSDSLSYKSCINKIRTMAVTIGKLAWEAGISKISPLDKELQRADGSSEAES